MRTIIKKLASIFTAKPPVIVAAYKCRACQRITYRNWWDVEAQSIHSPAYTDGRVSVAATTLHACKPEQRGVADFDSFYYPDQQPTVGK